MSLSASQLNTNRYTSILADLQAQFPIPVGLLPAEQTAYNNAQSKFAHAVADHEGTDVVAEVERGVVTITGVHSGSSTAIGAMA